MYKVLFQIFILKSLLMSTVLAGGPWTKNKNESYFQLGYNLISSNNKLFSNHYDFILLPYKLTDRTMDLYVEYGLTDKFTLLAYLPYKIVDTRGEYDVNNTLDEVLGSPISRTRSGGLSSFGNISLAGKYKIYSQSKVTMAGSINLSIPSGKENSAFKLSTGYQSWGIQPEFSIGTGGANYYGFLSMAYNIRGNMTDEYRMGAELGYKVYKSIYAILAVDALQSAKVLKPLDSSFLFLYPDQQEYIASTLKFSIPLNDELGFNFHMTIKTIGGNYVQKGPAMGGSIYWKF